MWVECVVLVVSCTNRKHGDRMWWLWLLNVSPKAQVGVEEEAGDGSGGKQPLDDGRELVAGPQDGARHQRVDLHTDKDSWN